MSELVEFIAVQDVLFAYFITNLLSEDDITLLNVAVGSIAAKKVRKLLKRKFNDVSNIEKTHGPKKRDGSFGDHKKNVYPNREDVRKELFYLFMDAAKDHGVDLPVRQGDLSLRVREGRIIAYVYQEIENYKFRIPRGEF